MRIFRRAAPARIASPVPSKPRVPGSGTVVVPPPQLLMVLPCSVTAPFCARALPQVMLALVFRVMLLSARIFPSNAVLVPRVAELPTCQKMFGSVIGLPVRLLIKMTDEALPIGPGPRRTADLKNEQCTGLTLESQRHPRRQISRTSKRIYAGRKGQPTQVLTSQVASGDR